MGHRHHHHRDRIRSKMRRNLGIGAGVTLMAILAVRILTWLNPQRLSDSGLWIARVGLLLAILLGLIGGIVLLVGIMQWMRYKSGA